MDLAHFGAAVRRYGWLIIVIGVTAGAIAFALSLMLPKTFESESGVIVGSMTETDPDQLLAFQRLAQTYAEVGLSAPTLENVISRTGVKDSPDQLAQRVQIRALTGLSVLRITAEAPTPTEAKALADTLADEVTILGKSTTGLPTSLATVFQPATQPDQPSSPRSILNAAIGALLGLAIGLGVALFLARPSAGPARSRADGRRVSWPA